MVVHNVIKNRLLVCNGRIKNNSTELELLKNRLNQLSLEQIKLEAVKAELLEIEELFKEVNNSNGKETKIA